MLLLSFVLLVSAYKTTNSICCYSKKKKIREKVSFANYAKFTSGIFNGLACSWFAAAKWIGQSWRLLWPNSDGIAVCPTRRQRRIRLRCEFEFDCIAKCQPMGRNVSFKCLAFQLSFFKRSALWISLCDWIGSSCLWLHAKRTSSFQLSIESQYIEPQCKMRRTNCQMGSLELTPQGNRSLFGFAYAINLENCF